MKHVFLSIVLAIASLFGASVTAHAQDIYKVILSDAKAVANNPQSNPTISKIARFKVHALQYTYEKAFDTYKEVTIKFLDDQAYYLNAFINSFISDVLINEKLSKSEKRQRIMLYIDASGSNPLFRDDDKDVVDAYVNDSKNQLTPFSLDTDWTRAYAAVMSKIK